MEIGFDPEKNKDERASGTKGGMRTMPFIIANEALDKVASVGLHANMILYLRNEYHFDNATGANILFLWGAISNFLPILGAFLSDSYMGRFRVIASGSVVSLMGMIALWSTTLFKEARPPHCELYAQNCTKPNHPQLALLFFSFALMSIGSGGIRPCSLAFGADQFYNPDSPNNEKTLQSFFNWYYASVGVSIMVSVTVIVYIQNTFGWEVGFGVPVGLMLFSTLLFFLGSSLYVKVNANKSLITSFANVVMAAWRNKHLPFPPPPTISTTTQEGILGCYHHHKGSKFISPTQRLRFLNKACIIRKPEKSSNPTEPWTPCTVREVEELKALIKVLPLWSTGIMIAVIISQQAFPILQASTMDRRFIGDFKIPPGSFPAFALLTLTLWVALYDRIIVPWLSKHTGRPRGLSFRQRMGIGLVLSCFATAAAASVERARRNRAAEQGLTDNPLAVVDMSAMWLVPQYSLIGLAEAFNAIGQIEFYYAQFPKGMTSIAVALFAMGMAVGNLVGSLIVSVVDGISGAGDGESWVAKNMNKGHYDYYYWILTVLSMANLFYFWLCSWAYGCCDGEKIWDEEEESGMAKPNESPILDIAKGKESPLVFAL